MYTYVHLRTAKVHVYVYVSASVISPPNQAKPSPATPSQNAKPSRAKPGQAKAHLRKKIGDVGKDVLIHFRHASAKPLLYKSGIMQRATNECAVVLQQNCAIRT